MLVAKIIFLTKMNFSERGSGLSALSTCTTIAQDQQTDDGFISPISNYEQEDDNDTKMDCSTKTKEIKSFNDDMNGDHLLPSNELSTEH
jgi:hypothetical protein